MNAEERVLSRLGDQFKRSHLMEICDCLGISYNDAFLMPKKLIHEGKIEEIDEATFRKVEYKQ